MYYLIDINTWPHNVGESLLLNKHILNQEAKSCWIILGHTAINIMLLKHIGHNVHVHAKYQSWIWFQKWICLMGLISTIILTIWGLLKNEIFFSFRSYWINEIYLSENKSTFLHQTETKEDKNKYQRAEWHKTSIRRANKPSVAERRRACSPSCCTVAAIFLSTSQQKITHISPCITYTFNA